MTSTQDTITAIATAPGEAGIAIVRVSGPCALRIADGVFRCRGAVPSQRAGGSFVYGHVCAGDGNPPDRILDEVVLLVFRTPNSYTREDTVELQCHGGSAAAQRVLRAVLDHGARVAEPGEFTRRAFLSGRIDLIQAEAVLDLIHARSDRAATAAVEQLAGRISIQFNSIYDDILSVAADMEATLDFSTEELPDAVYPAIRSRLAGVEASIDALLETWEEGRLLREGALVVISGEPNVGKSTLLNALLQSPRAIVSDMPGTTRDTIEETLVLAGIPLRLVDTAGIRPSCCDVEREGVDRARALTQAADFVILMVDASSRPGPTMADRIAALDPRSSIVVLNKIDLGDEFDAKLLAADVAIVRCSLLHGEAPAELLDLLRGMLARDSGATPRATISERHRQALMTAREHVQGVRQIDAQDQEAEAVLAASRLRDALQALGTATGRVYHDELLEQVFSRFCIGK